jgi:hypothetical protein
LAKHLEYSPVTNLLKEERLYFYNDDNLLRLTNIYFLNEQGIRYKKIEKYRNGDTLLINEKPIGTGGA